MKRLVVALSAAHVLTWVGIACAYGVPTHRDLSAAAVNASVLQTGPTLLSNLGLKPLGTPGQTFPNYQGNRGTIDVLVQDGAEFEDNNIRSRSHFYDPLTNEAISALGHTSPDWALEDRDTYLLQNDSFRSTRQFFLKALTSQSKEAREEAWGRTFQGLGQVIHHLQDMAQPQHVRHDKHLDLPIVTLPVIEDPSLYEEYTQQDTPQNNVRARLFPFFGGYAPVYGDADTTTTFNTPRSFWHTDDGKGIADYTNRGFVSAGTNFDQYDPCRVPLPE